MRRIFYSAFVALTLLFAGAASASEKDFGFREGWGGAPASVAEECKLTFDAFVAQFPETRKVYPFPEQYAFATALGLTAMTGKTLPPFAEAWIIGVPGAPNMEVSFVMVAEGCVTAVVRAPLETLKDAYSLGLSLPTS